MTHPPIHTHTHNRTHSHVPQVEERLELESEIQRVREKLHERELENTELRAEITALQSAAAEGTTAVTSLLGSDSITELAASAKGDDDFSFYGSQLDLDVDADSEEDGKEEEEGEESRQNAAVARLRNTLKARIVETLRRGEGLSAKVAALEAQLAEERARSESLRAVSQVCGSKSVVCVYVCVCVCVFVWRH